MNTKNATTRNVETLDNSIVICQNGNNEYDADGLRGALVDLRELIRCLAIASDSSDVSAARYEGEMIVLNWLIEEVELKDFPRL